MSEEYDNNEDRQTLEFIMTEFLDYDRWTDADGVAWYIKGINRIAESELLELSSQIFTNEYRRGYDAGYNVALQHIAGICQRELEDD